MCQDAKYYRRWIRLLFGREFSFDDVLPMWDIIFAEDPSLELVDFISLVMILRLHWDRESINSIAAIVHADKWQYLMQTITPL